MPIRLIRLGGREAQFLKMADIRKKKACFACLKNCVRLHGDVEDEEPEEEITPAGSSGPAPKENLVSERGPMENGAAAPYPSFLKKMTELSITSSLVITSFCRT